MMPDERVAPLHGLTLRESILISNEIDRLGSVLIGKGVSRVSTWWDMSILTAFNRSAHGMDYHALLPVYDVTQSEIEPHEAFWIACYDEDDKISATIAVRLRELRSSLKEALLDATLISPDQRLGFRGSFSGPLSRLQEMPELDYIQGDVALPGAMWVHESWRGRRLSETLFALSIVLSYRRWKPGHFVGLLELKKENPVGYHSYGFPRAHKFFVYTAPDPTLKGCGEEIAVMTMTQHEARQLFIEERQQSPAKAF